MTVLGPVLVPEWAQAQVREPEWVLEWVPELERAWDRERALGLAPA